MLDMESSIRVGDRVRLLDMPDWLLRDLPEDEQIEMRSFVGKCSEVEEIDNHGYYWVGFGSLVILDGTSYYTGHSFCIQVEYLQLVSRKEDTMSAFTFVPNVQGFLAPEAFVARVAGNIQTEQQLFELFHHLLKLPECFDFDSGFTWYVLFACLRDFHWINEREIVLVHDDLPGLPMPDRGDYLKVLHDAVVDWTPEDAHPLRVIFAEKDRAHVEAAMVERRGNYCG